MTAYRVSDGTQIHHGGRVYAAGATLTAYPAEAALWLLEGWVVEVGPARAAAKKVAAKSVGGRGGHPSLGHG